MGQLRQVREAAGLGGAENSLGRQQLGLSWFFESVLCVFDALLPAWIWPELSPELLEPSKEPLLQGRSDLLSPAEDSNTSLGNEVVLSIEVRFPAAVCLLSSVRKPDGASVCAGVQQAAEQGA